MKTIVFFSLFLSLSAGARTHQLSQSGKVLPTNAARRAMDLCIGHSESLGRLLSPQVPPAETLAAQLMRQIFPVHQPVFFAQTGSTTSVLYKRNFFGGVNAHFRGGINYIAWHGKEFHFTNPRILEIQGKSVRSQDEDFLGGPKFLEINHSSCENPDCSRVSYRMNTKLLSPTIPYIDGGATRIYERIDADGIRHVTTALTQPRIVIPNEGTFYLINHQTGRPDQLMLNLESYASCLIREAQSALTSDDLFSVGGSQPASW